jgi:branched-chain amino acid transport system substrate-binding protein
MTPAVASFFKKYQSQAPTEGVDLLGHYLGGWGYALLQLLGDAIEGTKSLNDDQIADYIRSNSQP